MQINEVWLVLEHEVHAFVRKVPNCFIYLNEVPGRVISSVVSHEPSVIKGEIGIFQYQIHPLHSTVFINHRNSEFVTRTES